MNTAIICCAGKSAASAFVRRSLEQQGLRVSSVPDWNTRHLLLDVPIRTDTEAETLLSSLHPGVTIWGGHLKDTINDRFRAVDFLEDEEYLFQNAAITADCTIPILESHLKTSWEFSPALIIGWGRIGKCLAALLMQKGCTVSIASTRVETRNDILSGGYRYIGTEELKAQLKEFRIIINTAPALMLDEAVLSRYPDCLKVDLASVKGLGGPDVIWARALPGRLAPEASGRLIAETFLRRWKEESK